MTLDSSGRRQTPSVYVACPVCGTGRKVRKDGRVSLHDRKDPVDGKPRRCPGSGTRQP